MTDSIVHRMERILGVERGRSLYLLLLLCLSAGSVSAGSLGWTVTPAAALPLLLLLLVPLLFRRTWILLVPPVSLLLFLYGNHRVAALVSAVHPAGHIALRGGTALTVEGIVAERPERADGGGRVLLDVTAAGLPGGMSAATGRLLVRSGEGSFSLAAGDLVRLRGRVKIPRPLGLPGEFDYGRHLALRGIGATLFVARSDEAVLVTPAAVPSTRRSIDALASAAGRVIDTAVGGATGEILKALLTGERGGVPRQVEETYARAGVSHLLSISGFHVGVLALVILQLLLLMARGSERLLLRCNVRRLLPLMTLPFIIFYLLLSGGAIATVRSVVMAGICAIVLLADRETDLLHSLFIAALLILCAAPQAIYDISFQLSFMALWGIMLTAPLIAGPVARIPVLPLRWLAALLIASAAATLATLAPVAWHFSRGSLAGIIANLAAVPLVGYGGVAVGFAGLLLFPVLPPLGTLLLQSAGLMVRLANGAIELAARIPPLHWAAEWYDVLFSLAILMLLSLVTSVRRRMAFLSCILAAWIAVTVAAGHQRDGTFTVTFLSVGQGDSTLVRTPTGETMLVDGGGYPGERGELFGRRMLVPALERLGVRRIERLVLSHPHPDHLGGLSAVVDRFPVDEFWFPVGCDEPPELLALQQSVRQKGGHVRPVSGGTPAASLGDCTVQFLAPCGPPSGDGNEDSLVLRIQWQRWRVLLTGDIGSGTESGLLAARAPLAAEVLKVAHHGSRYSSSAPFLQAVAPREAVISTGRGNIYGLPAAETVERLLRYGCTVHRTDMSGTITVVCDHDNMRVVQYNEGQKQPAISH